MCFASSLNSNWLIRLLALATNLQQTKSSQPGGPGLFLEAIMSLVSWSSSEKCAAYILAILAEKQTSFWPLESLVSFKTRPNVYAIGCHLPTIHLILLTWYLQANTMYVYWHLKFTGSHYNEHSNFRPKVDGLHCIFHFYHKMLSSQQLSLDFQIVQSNRE